MPFLRVFTGFPIVLGAVIAVAATACASAEPIKVAGTGAGIAVVRHIGDEFMSSYPDRRIEVLPSIGSSGGLRALAGGKIAIAMAGRRIGADDEAKGLRQAACLRTPFVLATSLAEPPALTADAIAGLFGNPDARWPDGRPVRIVLRNEGDSAMRLLIKHVPGMQAAFDAARRRIDVPVALTDQENGDIAESVPGSLTAMGLMQIMGERRRLRSIPLDGTAPSVEALEAGPYKLASEVCLVVTAQAAPAVHQFIDFVHSSAGREAARSLAALVVVD